MKTDGKYILRICYYWKFDGGSKKVLRYLQWTNNHMLTYRRSNYPKVIGYTNSFFVVCVKSSKSTFSYMYLLAK